MNWFRKIERGLVRDRKRDMPDGLWRKCDGCGEIIYERVIHRNNWTCIKCGYHFIVTAREYISILADPGSFKETDSAIRSGDPLNFRDSKKYTDRLKSAMKKTGLNEAAVTGRCDIGKHPACIAALDFKFMGGSMASVVGEKIARATKIALEEHRFLVIVSSSGGARMQEGILSLMQMAKTSAWLARFADEGLLYVSLLTHPTTGGVTASFAMLGDIIIAEPGALVGFAGPRVVQQTINQELPKGFQRAEFLLDHGMVDMVVPRTKMKQTLVDIFDFFGDIEKPVEEKQKPGILKTPPHLEVKVDRGNAGPGSGKASASGKAPAPGKGE
jgi:acetyl-CoA carboxylase carboxyl transferase subunit beta